MQMWNACAREYPVIIKDGDKIICEIQVTEYRGNYAYALKMKKAYYRVISKERYNTIIANAKANGYQIFDYGNFDQTEV